MAGAPVCATGQIIKTGAQWGDLVRAAYPTFTGARPKMQLWHGSVDNVLYFPNLGEEIKQSTNVLGASTTPADSEPNQPQSTWTRRSYTNSSGQTVVRRLWKRACRMVTLMFGRDLAVQWLGLDKATSIENGNGAFVTVNGQNAEVRIVRHDPSNSLSFVVPSFPDALASTCIILAEKSSIRLPSNSMRSRRMGFHGTEELMAPVFARPGFMCCW